MALKRKLAAAAFGVLALGGIGAGVANAATTPSAPPPASSPAADAPTAGDTPDAPLSTHRKRVIPLTHPAHRTPTMSSRATRTDRTKEGPRRLTPLVRVTDRAV